MCKSQPHIPVMLQEAMRNLAVEPGDCVVDATFGAGGYSRAILENGADVIGIDRDPNAISAGQVLVQHYDGRLRLVEDRFANLAHIVNGQVDGIVADIGVSSMQIDQGERGFSFQQDGPLDMRMAASGVSAADVVNLCDQGPGSPDEPASLYRRRYAFTLPGKHVRRRS